MTDAARTVGIVLAAGAASRFGSPKALASLDGRPLLQHVVDAAAGLGLAGRVMVLGRAAEAILRAIDPRGADAVRNRDPEAGLASSLRLGLDWVVDHHPDAEATLVLLGDQPLVRADVVRALLAAPVPPGCSIVVPLYAGGGGPNPALLLRAAWPVAMALEGDRGMGPFIDAHPELVVEVQVGGANPDIDTPSDLRRVAAGLRVGHSAGGDGLTRVRHDDRLAGDARRCVAADGMERDG